MCGIGGFFGSYDEPLLQRMRSVLAHRGPDDSGVLYKPDLGLGFCHTRLAIIDLSPGGHQPYTDEYERAVITFNGELYNYRDVRRMLEKKGERFTTKSDTEVMLKAYLVYGEEMYEHLRGIFAFAIFDYRSKQLIVARDHLGVKPLYYSVTRNGFIFSSEIKGLFQSNSVNKDINPEAVISHLMFLWSPGNQTIVNSIKRLEPGTFLKVRNSNEIEKRTYYIPPTGMVTQHMSTEEAINGVRTHLESAVEMQMVSDVPVGAFLSGGLDSSALVALANRQIGDLPFECFTVAYSGKAARHAGITLDLPYAKSVANTLNVNLNIAHINSDIFTRLPEMIYHLEEPMADPAALNTLVIAEMARERDIKVLLSGLGGDDVFAGYRRHYAIMVEKYWQWLPSKVKRALQSLSSRKEYRSTLSRRVRKMFQYADESTDERLISYLYWITPAMVTELLKFKPDPNFKGGTAKQEILRGLKAHCSQSCSKLNKALYIEQRHFLPDHNLIYADKMAMASGVEVRVPFLDTELVKMASQIPPMYKQKGRISKWVLKKSVEDIVPSKVINRPKTGFGLPLRSWIVGPMREMLNDYLSAERLNRRGLFDPVAVQNLIKENEQDRIDAAFPIFAILCIEIWFDVFADGNV